MYVCVCVPSSPAQRPWPRWSSPWSGPPCCLTGGRGGGERVQGRGKDKSDEMDFQTTHLLMSGCEYFVPFSVTHTQCIQTDTQPVSYLSAFVFSLSHFSETRFVIRWQPNLITIESYLVDAAATHTNTHTHTHTQTLFRVFSLWETKETKLSSYFQSPPID